MVSEVAERPPTVTALHKKWVKELDKTLRNQRLEEEERAASAAASAESIKQFNSTLRSAILAGEDVSFWKAAKGKGTGSGEASAAASTAAGGSGSKEPAAAVAGPKPGLSDQDIADFVEAAYREAQSNLQATLQAASQSAAAAGGDKSVKVVGEAAAAAAGTSGSSDGKQTADQGPSKKADGEGAAGSSSPKPGTPPKVRGLGHAHEAAAVTALVVLLWCVAPTVMRT